MLPSRLTLPVFIRMWTDWTAVLWVAWFAVPLAGPARTKSHRLCLQLRLPFHRLASFLSCLAGAAVLFACVVVGSFALNSDVLPPTDICCCFVPPRPPPLFFCCCPFLFARPPAGNSHVLGSPSCFRQVRRRRCLCRSFFVILNGYVLYVRYGMVVLFSWMVFGQVPWGDVLRRSGSVLFLSI